MNEITFPTQPTSTLIKASIVAIVVAVVLYVTIILPAEYNIDPLGTGKVLGLTVLAENTSTDTIEPQIHNQTTDIQDNEVTLLVPANKGIEYKFKMQQYSNITYHWTSDGAPLFFDFHGEPKGDTTGYFESYTLATNSEMKGSMTVPFEGSHGWYWKNVTDKDVHVTLKTTGNYEIIGSPH